MDTNDEWIQERTGIKQRRHIKKGDGNSTSVMGAKAAKIAIERASLTTDDIDLIIFATLSPEMYFPVPVIILSVNSSHTCVSFCCSTK